MNAFRVMGGNILTGLVQQYPYIMSVLFLGLVVFAIVWSRTPRWRQSVRQAQQEAADRQSGKS